MSHEQLQEPGLFTVDSFCTYHQISRAVFYRIVKDGYGPKTFKIGRRTYISKEAAEAWRRSMESDAA
jgi:predicted DNA-binding transcriptional regulator AlpA